jgi:hypothetical protein
MFRGCEGAGEGGVLSRIVVWVFGRTLSLAFDSISKSLEPESCTDIGANGLLDII